VKKIKKKHKKDIIINTSPSIKMSTLIAEYASDYINRGDTTEERENYLRGACTAWNIAVLPEHLREEALCHHRKEYTRLNPGIDDADDVMHDIRLLIVKKLQMFPSVRKVIVDAGIEPINATQYRINVVSTDNPKQFFK